MYLKGPSESGVKKCRFVFIVKPILKYPHPQKIFFSAKADKNIFWGRGLLLYFGFFRIFSKTFSDSHIFSDLVPGFVRNPRFFRILYRIFSKSLILSDFVQDFFGFPDFKISHGTYTSRDTHISPGTTLSQD